MKENFAIKIATTKTGLVKRTIGGKVVKKDTQTARNVVRNFPIRLKTRLEYHRCAMRVGVLTGPGGKIAQTGKDT